MRTLINYQDMENLTPGMSRITCESMGECTFVGWSAEGCIVVQRESDFTTLPEIAFNLMHWRRPFEPETHVRFITEESIAMLNRDHEGSDIYLSTEYTALHKYKVTIHINEHIVGDQQ